MPPKFIVSSARPESTPISISKFLHLVAMPAQRPSGDVLWRVGEIQVVMFLVEQAGG